MRSESRIWYVPEGICVRGPDLMSSFQRSRRHFTYLSQFPLSAQPGLDEAYQRNQRRLLLYGIGSKVR